MTGEFKSGECGVEPLRELGFFRANGRRNSAGFFLLLLINLFLLALLFILRTFIAHDWFSCLQFFEPILRQEKWRALEDDYT